MLVDRDHDINTLWVCVGSHRARGISLCEMGTTEVFTLVQGDDDGFGAQDLSVHLGDGTSGFFGGTVADESEPFRESRDGSG